MPSQGLLRFSDDTEEAEKQLLKLISDMLDKQVKEGFPLAESHTDLVDSRQCVGEESSRGRTGLPPQMPQDGAADLSL